MQAIRRQAPLLVWIAIWTGTALLHLIAHEPQGHVAAPIALPFTLAVCAAAYALGAYTDLFSVAAGLLVAAPVIAGVSDKGGLLTAAHSGKAAVAGALLQTLALALVGVLVRARRRTAALAAHGAALRRQAERAAAAERARIARELHDSVAHHLSVIVLQAAGTRASGKPAEVALEKIEHSARQALTETRRLLGVLRDPDETAALAPQPGIGELDELADSVRAAGLAVNLVVSGDRNALPTAVDVSVYRIVQESLTNVLKHAGPAYADVTIDCATEIVTIEVTDNGVGDPDNPPLGGGHGLAGMRERATVLGGELAAGPQPGGGFAVYAWLPRREGVPAGEPA